tara:strand:+ start:2826 stop:4658 length:1833 start_codon:yes stop_codon:yes gene_type:complete
MHVTELTESHVDELKQYIEINELGHIITKKKNTCKSNTMMNGLSGDSKTQIGKRRGGKTKYGMNFGFKFPSSKEKLTCKAREIVWVFSNGLYDPAMVVKPKNEDLFDDRIENLHLKKRDNGRPPQTSDNTSRKPRVKYTKGQIRKISDDIIKLTASGLSLPQACKKLGISKSAGSKWAKMNDDYKPAWNCSEVSDKKKYDLENLDSDSGIYVMVFRPTGPDRNNQISRCYIGSSVNTKKRIESHLRELKNNKHYNKKLQECFNNGMKLHLYLLEPCDEEDLLTKEEEWRCKYNEGSLLNKNKAPTMEEMKPWLEVAKEKSFNKNKYTVNEKTGCWEWKVLDKNGYGNSIHARIKGKKTKYIRPHRLSYYIHKGEYPELIRHRCHNKCCVNPDHLEEGSHRQNALDNTDQIRQEFEYWWLRYERSIEKLTQHFDWSTVGTALSWERKLGLREKYPDIYWENSKYLSPEEKQKQEEEKEIRRNAKSKKQLQFEKSLKYKERAVNLKRRFYGNAVEISEYLNLPYGDVCKMVKDVKEPWRRLMECEWFLNKNVPYDGIDVKYIENLQKLHPEYAKDIEDNYAWHMFPVEAGLFTAFRRAKMDRKRKRVLIEST